MHPSQQRRRTWRVSPRAAASVTLLAASLLGCTATAATPETLEAAADIPRLLSVGAALIQEARETSDQAALERAEQAFLAVLEADPDDVEAIIGLGSIALSRHDFARALELGTAVAALAPGNSRALGITVDALVELGRYEEATEVVERMVRTRPDLSSYARLSYLHELHGRLGPAIGTMEQAVIAGGPARENTEYTRVLLGDLWLMAGDAERATFLYRAALRNDPSSVLALRGLARAAASAGHLEGSIDLLERAVARTPLPELLVLLGETQEAAGLSDEAAATYRLVSEIMGLQRAVGVLAEPGLAVFEADHGDIDAAVEQAQAAYGAAPSIRAADAMAWALHRAGRSQEALPFLEQALATGSLEPTFHYHAGAIFAALGRTDEAVAALSREGVTDARWSPLHAGRAATLLEDLS